MEDAIAKKTVGMVHVQNPTSCRHWNRNLTEETEKYVDIAYVITDLGR